MRNFNPSSKHPERAVQAWQILVSAGMNRQTFTYEGLSHLMYGKNAAGVISQILGHIAFYCLDNGLPALTSIVVGKDKGVPGDEIPLEPEDTDAEREHVYQLNWYDVYPPSSGELSSSFKNHQSA